MENILLKYASSIENVDYSLYEWLNDEMNLSCNTKDGFKKVPVLWVSPERSFQSKNSKEYRDNNGTINPPAITIERTKIEKDQKNNGTFYNNLPPNNDKIIIAKRINQQKTSEFIKAQNERIGGINFISPKKSEKIVYEFTSVLLPVYVNFTYTINIFTQFQQQMNEILQPFITKTGSNRYFITKRNGYKYENFIDSNIETKNNVNNMEEEERRYFSTINIKTLANLTSNGENQEDKIIKTYENAVEVRIPRDNLLITKP